MLPLVTTTHKSRNSVTISMDAGCVGNSTGHNDCFSLKCANSPKARLLLLFGRNDGFQILLSTLLAIAPIGGRRDAAGDLLCLIDGRFFDAIAAIHDATTVAAAAATMCLEGKVEVGTGLALSCLVG